ncbi:MAG: hypothetical protein JWO44_1615 [Bacteroidetes bacterium]|jgi:hypothetical protein|nr:hypothetical protein [Bacteroidota bacterium]
MKKQKSIPFSFVLDNLHQLDPIIKPLFGCHSIYIGNKIVMALREKDDEDSGVWIATAPEFHSSLKKEFPGMRSIRIFGTGTSSWQVLPKDTDDFETSVNHLCELVIKGDPRIGKIPKPKKKKSL